MRELGSYLKSNALGAIAIFIALGGTGYAAANLPRGSVGTAALRNHSVTPVKLGNGIAGSVRTWAVITPTGKVVASRGKPNVSVPGGPAPTGFYIIDWGVPVPKTCATVANIDVRGATGPTETVTTPVFPGANVIAGYASQVSTIGGSDRSRATTPVTSLATFNQAGQLTPLPFDVAVIC
jgi:hypothetical protein